jgi:hypothetical protein
MASPVSQVKPMPADANNNGNPQQDAAANAAPMPPTVRRAALRGAREVGSAVMPASGLSARKTREGLVSCQSGDLP